MSASLGLVDAVLEERATPELAALLVARDAKPELDVQAQLSLFDELAAPLAGLGDENEPQTQAAALAAHLHGALGFHGNAESYFDARNSYLDEVLGRRTGIPITLSVVYVATTRRVGVQVDGVGFPGHFLARVGGPDGVLIDPFHGGRALSEAAIEALGERALGGPGRLRAEHLAPIGLRALVVRMLLNLKHVHERERDHPRALVVADRLYDLTQRPEFRRDRGLHALALGAHGQARDDLEAYLAQVGERARDAAAVRSALERVARGRAHES